MTAAQVEVHGVTLAYEESGEGDAVLLVHGMATDRRIWRETIEALGGGLRAIAYDRRAYGGSGAPEPYGGTTVEEQAEDAAALIAELGAAPAILCGHSLGAMICIDLLLRHADLARGAVLIEPPLLWLSPKGSAAVGRLREAAAEGAREGGPPGAVDAVLAELAGPEVVSRLDAERLEAARSAARAMAVDMAAAPAWRVERRRLREIGTPAIVVAGSRSSAAWRDAARALADLLGNAELRDAPAAHGVQFEAPDAVAAAIRDLADAPQP